MSDNNTGGPAFPVFAEQYDFGQERVMPKQVAPGMDLRDYFAACALQGFIGNVSAMFYNPEDAAKKAYVIADAMLKAREK